MNLFELINIVAYATNRGRYNFIPCNNDKPDGDWVCAITQPIKIHGFDTLIEKAKKSGNSEQVTNLIGEMLVGRDYYDKGIEYENLMFSKHAKSVYQFLKKTEVEFDYTRADFESNIKRNFLQIRGKPLTLEQTADAIVNTSYAEMANQISIFDNDTFSLGSSGGRYFIYPSGMIYDNRCSGCKWTDVWSLINDAAWILYLCPYIDFAAVFTHDDEIPNEVSEERDAYVGKIIDDKMTWEELEQIEYKLYNNLHTTYDWIEYGVRIEPGKITIIINDTQKSYKMFKRYKDKYEPAVDDINNHKVISKELKKLLQARGLKNIDDLKVR
jgi:hypothetical protein